MWRVLQLADSAFPTGGFAHSAGLEAAVQLGEVQSGADLQRFAAASLWQAGLGSLPFVGAAHDRPESLGALDAECDAFLSLTVQNRASRTQGRAFLATCSRVFPSPALTDWDDRAQDGVFAAHLAPAFGAALREIGVSRTDAATVMLHLSLRAVTSAAVRLGVVGPHEAQRVIRELGAVMDEVRGRCAGMTTAEVAQPVPWIEVLGGAQDRLYSRLFQS